MNNITLRLRQIRRDRNLSQEELAQKLGISRQAIIAIEQGESLPSLPVIMAMLRVFDLTFRDLFADGWQPFRQFNIEDTDDRTSLATYRHKESSQHIPIHMQEDDKAIAITAELPGVKEEDLSVDLSAQHILIMAVKKSPERTEATHHHINEIHIGPVMRIIGLPSPINPAAAQAEFNRGILRLTLPKEYAQPQRRITFKESNGPK